MITIKSLIKYDNANCIEVTWVETKKVTLPQQEMAEGISDLVLRQQKIETVIHCQAYADVQIDMLRADAEKYGTSLDEYEDIIAEVEAGIVYPTPEEIAEQEKQAKLQECYAYLNSTDYKMSVDYYNSMTQAEQLEVIAKRAEAREFIRLNKW